ncbi:inducible metalloproteinase inhibitor protein-like [Trichoplusia ni]|uniref:Inducible metalloproteinase inhibitor protein-like n=1 Tax=Trichoplusia ni TaxID=7111 RepID=A0A7E5VMF4_TRINI|nr:inducible metalloproteinase inhibitor protein-like [Trichoplusia ni]
MTGTVFFSLCIIFLSIGFSRQLSCGPGEVVDNCLSNCLDYCPVKENQDRDCFAPVVCGTPRCKCAINRRRDVNGTCIPTTECPPFKCNRPNEEYVACPPYCPTDDCKQATPDGKCPLLGRILIVVECIPACRCIKGYWRRNGVCVPYEECPLQFLPKLLIG